MPEIAEPRLNSVRSEALMMIHMASIDTIIHLNGSLKKGTDARRENKKGEIWGEKEK